MGKQNMAGLPAYRCFENRVLPRKITLFCDCVRPSLVIRFAHSVLLNSGTGRESELTKFIFIHKNRVQINAFWLLLFLMLRQTQQHLTILRSWQMKSFQAKIRFASVLLFGVLSMNFLAAQSL